MESLASSKTQSWLSWFLRGVLILGFLVLIGRLFDLQIIRGSYYRNLSEGNRIRRVPVIAPRGKILARGGEILAGSEKVKMKVIFDENEGFIKDSEITGATEDEIITEWIRDYSVGEEVGHVLGYVGETNVDEVGKVKAECPDKGPRKLGSLIGRTGLEETYECVLGGVDGEELVEVDAFGKKIRLLGKKEAQPGENITTSIDLGLQIKIHELMRGKKGAVIVTDGVGEILAFYSSPSYDPNIFVKKDKSIKLESALKDTNLPLFNRVISGKFHPGSVYKPVVAIAALEENEIDEDFIFEDTGRITIQTSYGTFTYSNWYFTQYGGTEGKINLVKALARSTDTFFYKIGEMVGIDNLNSWSKKFGLDKETGIDLSGEIPGLIPSPEWKMKTKGERWFLGNTYHMSIGQGDVSLTPIGVNTAILAIANGGKHCSSRFVKETECVDLGINNESIDLVKKGMVAACTSGGTGFTFFDFKDVTGKEVACKTGTAETENGEPHAWFVAFAPSDEPEIVATVLVENGGEGSSVAGPIAREIFNYWFKVQPAVSPSPTPADD